MSTTICHDCYREQTAPAWVAETVIRWSRNTPCEKHRARERRFTFVLEDEVQTLGGMKIGQSDLVAVGMPIAMYDGSGEVGVFMHPFDVIAVKHPRDPLARSQAVADHLTQRAHRQLDLLLERVNRGRR